ncbi:hypothetical protein PSAC2689_40124 [Paraburkholderia sacchari]
MRLDVQRQANVDAIVGVERRARRPAREVRIRAGLDRHVRADDDLRFLIVERDEVRRGQHIGVARLRERLQQCAKPLHTENIVDPAHVQALLDGRAGHEAREAARGGAGRRRRRQVDDAVAGAGREVGPGHHVAIADLPLDTEVGVGVRVELDDQRLDVDLCAPRVELVDHGAQVAIHRVRRRDNQRVGRRIGLDHAAGLILVAFFLVAAEELRIGVAAAGRTARQRIARRHAAAAAERTGQRRGARKTGRGVAVAATASATASARVLVERIRTAARRRFVTAFAQHPAQGLGKLHRVGVAQRNDVNIARHARRRVKLLRQLRGRGEALRVRGAQHQRVGARVGHDRNLQRRIRGADRARIEHLRNLRRDVERVGIAQRHHLHLLACGRVHAGDDRGDAAHVVRIVGHDKRVVARIRGDGVVRRNKRAQHGQQIVRRLVLQREHLRDHLVAARRGRVAHVGRHALELGIGLGHDLEDAMVLHEREALHAQRRLQRLERLILWHRVLGYEIELPLHARIDNDRFAGGRADGLRHLIDVGVDEVKRDLGVRELRRHQPAYEQRLGDAAQSHTISSHGYHFEAGEGRRRPVVLIVLNVLAMAAA